MEKICGRLLLPELDKLKFHPALFYRGGNPAVLEEDGKSYIYIASGVNLDFATYLNGFSQNKWKLYTNIKGVRFSLEAQGSFILNICGFSLNPLVPERKVLVSQELAFKERQALTLDIPENNEEFIGFEIIALEPSKLYDASYIGEFDEDREINLAIATTTCFKEKFIKFNVALLKEQLLSGNDDIARHLYVNVVDNGRTLAKEDIEGYHVKLFPNINAGGSGGYARGMMESLRMEPKITHVLLMDDDVLVLPESIRRTYVLLSVLKEEYHDAYISGAMLDYNAMFLQFEDVGTVQKSGYLLKAKPDYVMTEIANVMNNNHELPYVEHMYAAWWYCCMPRHMIKKNGLPMPLFIRGDDVEYGLRSHTRFLTMSSICVWHMGFANKYNAFLLMYQSLRNLLIVRASSDDIKECNVIGTLDENFRERIRELNYNSAELVCRALEDFLKGPSFIANADGEQIMKEYKKLNEQMKPLSSFDDIEVRLDAVGGDEPMPLFKKIEAKVTSNGHRFLPKMMLDNQGVGIVSYDGRYQPGRVALKSTVLAVNPIDKTAALRKFDKKRYKELQKRYSKLRKEYDKRIGELEVSYRQAKKYFVTEAFWEKYLGLDK